MAYNRPPQDKLKNVRNIGIAAHIDAGKNHLHRKDAFLLRACPQNG